MQIKKLLSYFCSSLTLVFFLFVVVCFFLARTTFNRLVHIRGDYTSVEKMWVPGKYVEGNKTADGRYFLATDISISGTAVDVKFDSTFEKLAADATENDVIVTPLRVHYLAKNHGFVYHTWVDQHQESDHHILSIQSVGSDTLTIFHDLEVFDVVIGWIAFAGIVIIGCMCLYGLYYQAKEAVRFALSVPSGSS